MMNESLPLDTRLTIATAIAPYIHPKLGMTAPPRFIEVPIELPDFQTIEEAESFLASLATRFAQAELGAQSALDLSTLVRNWIFAKHAAMELELKRLAANDSTGNRVIRIEGGLPDLAGTSIIMPELPPGPDVIEVSAVDGPVTLTKQTESLPSEVPDPAAPDPAR
jgi:hypothetical protein